MRKALIILIIAFFCGCGEAPNNQEIEQLKAEIKQCKKEFDFLNNQYITLRDVWEMCNEDLTNTNAQLNEALKQNR